MRRKVRIAIVLSLSFGGIAACTSQVPDSATGIGFGSEADAVQARELELAGGAATADRLAPPQAVSSEALPPATLQPVVPAPRSPGSVSSAQSGGAADIAADTAAVLAATSPSGAAPVVAPTGLSAENDFSAVSESRTIESDAALIATNRAQYQVVQPTVLPERTDGTQPNIVGYALATSHPVGTRIHSRSGINLTAKAERNCRNFSSSDLAQIEFLSRGGPERDRAGLDPDGDGYACGWDPNRFRNAVQN